MLNRFINNKKRDLRDLIMLIRKVEKIKNPQLTAPIHSLISSLILSESKQIKELEEINKIEHGENKQLPNNRNTD